MIETVPADSRSGHQAVPRGQHPLARFTAGRRAADAPAGCIRKLRYGFSSLLAIVIVLSGGAVLRAEAATANAGAGCAPMVSGFERFGRDHQIDRQLAGRLLISELSCTACHASEQESLRPKAGPDLTAAGNRLSRDWMQRFIANPPSTKPGTTMPDVLHGHSDQQRGQVAAALAAYLSALRAPLSEIKGTGLHPVPHQFWKLGDVDHGRTLFHRVGCVACHAADPQYEAAEMPASQTDQLLELLEPEELEALGLASAGRPGPVQPLGELAQQYSLRSLALFLLDPEATRPGGRMPNFKLSAVDAADIASYLMRRSTQQPVTADFTTADAPSAAEVADPLVAQGRKLFTELRCVNCHQAEGQKPRPANLSLDQIDLAEDSGCIAAPAAANAETATIAAPRFAVDAEQTEAIAIALADSPTLENHQRLGLKLLQLNCYACHQRDGLGGVSRDRRAYFETVAHEDLGDEGRLPPPLSGVGRKAVPAWLNRVLRGDGEIRPHMHARMPKFPAAAVEPLAELVIQVDRASAVAGDKPERRSHAAAWPAAKDTQQVGVGRSMMDAGCVQCHSFRGEALPGVIGVDLSGIAERVEPEWFHAFVFNPGAVKPRTRMPSFFPDGKSQNTELLGGDADRQIAAMWGYLKTLSKQPLPAKIEEARAKNFELMPADRPILLRTFMRQAGTHAIAVGFPQQVHFAFAADTLRLSTAWRGRFLDAQGTWYVRAAPPADPLGEDLITLSDADLFLFAAQAGPPPQQRFGGYRLDEQGIPSFAYVVGNLQVEDRITPLAAPTGNPSLAAGEASRRIGLKRILRLQDSSPTRRSQSSGLPVAIRLLSGQQLTEVDPVTMKNEQGLSVTVPAALASLARQRSDDGAMSWVLPLWHRDKGDRSLPGLAWGESGQQPAGEDGVIELELGYQW